MWRKLIPVQVEKCFLYCCKISERNTYHTPNYWKEHHKVEEIMKGQATVHSTLLAVHVCVCMCAHTSFFFLGGGGHYCHQIYVARNSNKQECSICTSNNNCFINNNPPKWQYHYKTLNIVLRTNCMLVILQWSNTFSALCWSERKTDILCSVSYMCNKSIFSV